MSRAIRRRLGVVAAAALTVLPLTFAVRPAAAGAAETAASAPADVVLSSPVGTWQADVHVPDVGTHQATFSFTAGGRACLAGEAIEGTGTWWRTGPNRFDYRIFEKVYDEDGTHWLSIDVNQNAVQNRHTYTSFGISHFFEPDGTPSGSTAATVSATRTSTSDPHC